MAVSLEELGINRMSVDDRLALVQAIWESIATSADHPPLSPAFRAELDQRLADHKANPDDTIPWEEAKAAALARMKQ